MATESIEIPIFTGDDLRQWIDWLIEFFEREQFTDDDDKLNFSQSVMEGEARAWFLRRIRIFETWDELKRSLLIRFGRYDDPERINILVEEDQRWKALKNQLGNEIRELSNAQPHESLVKKTEFPVFDGFMPYGWICRVERLFRAGEYCEAAKLALVSESLEGDARDWYSEEVIKGEFITWFSFKKRLLARFAPEENGYHSDVSTHVPEIVQDPVLKYAKLVESTSNEALQAASETCSHALPEPSYGLVLEALPCEIASGGLFVQEKEEPYILQVQLEGELTPPSIDSESIHCVPKVVNKEFLRDKTRNYTRKQSLSPKSWRFKYKKRMKMSINSQLLGSAMVKANRVGWLLKRKKPWLLRYNVRENDILEEKNKGTCSVFKDISDALVSLSGKKDAGVNKRLPICVRKTEKKLALRCKKFHYIHQLFALLHTRPGRLLTVKLCLNEPVKAKVILLTPEQKRVTQKIILMKYHRTWTFKYKQKHFLLHHCCGHVWKQEHVCWFNVACLLCGLSIQCWIFALKNRELCRNWGCSRKSTINREQGPKSLLHRETLRVVTLALVAVDSAVIEAVTVEIEYIVWEVYTEVKALQLQTITGLVFQDSVAGIKNTNVAQETPWQGRAAFRVQLDLSRELAQALRVLPDILKGGLQIVHSAAIFQVKHAWKYKPFLDVSELELKEDGASLQRDAFVVISGVVNSFSDFIELIRRRTLTLSMDQYVILNEADQLHQWRSNTYLYWRPHMHVPKRKETACLEKKVRFAVWHRWKTKYWELLI